MLEDDLLQKDLDDNLEKERLDTTETADENESNEERRSLYRQESEKNEPSGKIKAKKKGGAKKFGPVGLILAVLLGSLFGFSALMSPALAINHFATALDDKLNLQDIFMSTRSNQLIKSKWLKESPIKVKTSNSFFSLKADRFSSMSPKLIDRMTKTGDIQLDFTSGKQTVTGRKIPDRVIVNNVEYDATKFANTYATDSNFRKTIKQSSKGKFGRMVDSLVTKLKTRIKATAVKLRPKIKTTDGSDTKSSTDVEANMRSEMTDNVSGKQKPADIPDKFPGDTDVKIDTSAVEELNSTKNSNRSNNVSATGAKKAGKFAAKMASKTALFLFDHGKDICNIYNAAVAANTLAKTTNAFQLIRFALTFVSVAHSIKAGTATEEEIAFLGNRLMSMVPSVDGQIRTAMDSTGFLYSAQDKLRNDINPTDDPSAAQFQNASSGWLAELIAQLKSVGSFSNVCSVLSMNLFSNAWVQVGAAVASLAFVFVTGGAGAAGLAAVGSAIGSSIGPFILGLVGSLAVNEISKSISTEYESAVTGIKVSSDTIGEDMGNAITAGLGNYHSKIAMDSGGGLMSKQAAASAFAAQKVMLAQKAADERSERSPFDISSPYTFLGSIIFKSWPYQSKATTTLGKIRAFFGLAKNFSQDLMPTSQAMAHATTLQSFEQCKDPDYKDLGAFDIFCNPIQGIPITALYDNSEATILGLNSPMVLVAENGNSQAPSYAGQYFTPEVVNNVLAKLAESNKEAENSVISGKDGDLQKYYKNCVNRGDRPYGAIFSQPDTGDNDFAKNAFEQLFDNQYGDLLDRGDACLLTNEELMNSKPADINEVTWHDYSNNGKKALLALFFADERAQCILDDDQDCQSFEDMLTMINGGGSGVGGGAGSCLWPIIGESTKSAYDSSNPQGGVTFFGGIDDPVVSNFNGEVTSVDVLTNGPLAGSTQIKMVVPDKGNVEVTYNNVKNAKVKVGEKLYLNQFIGEVGKKPPVGIPPDPATEPQIIVAEEGFTNIVAFVKLNEQNKYSVSLSKAGKEIVLHEDLTNLGGSTQIAYNKILNKIPSQNQDNIKRHGITTEAFDLAKGDTIGHKKSNAVTTGAITMIVRKKAGGDPEDPTKYLCKEWNSSSRSVPNPNDYTMFDDAGKINRLLSAIHHNGKIYQGANELYDAKCLQVAKYYGGVLIGCLSSDGLSWSGVDGKQGSYFNYYDSYCTETATEANDAEMKKDVLQKMWDEIHNHRPVIAMVRSGDNRHFVTVIGYKKGSNKASITEEDFIAIEPYTGRLIKMGNERPGDRKLWKESCNNRTAYRADIIKTGLSCSVN